ncbi:hypothetical protein [Tautonia plasticadhaerens]|uniref:Uncharacterized protein n=1 Tax=Tautonia plasticadhaerens TaxID=2527974 RepID=A0A518HEV4_9BACT|nr:hypothetical protein [Tautonia plasticadhaerens]QDV39296.1 hypothetical protein ElP_72600 [Tautonia plasticadhaerens]
MAANPISDLMYDWLTVLQSKAEGLNAYEKYIQDAQKENSQECVEMLRRLHEQDAKQVEQIRDHLVQMLSKQQGKSSRPVAAGSMRQSEGGG